MNVKEGVLRDDKNFVDWRKFLIIKIVKYKDIEEFCLFFIV